MKGYVIRLETKIWLAPWPGDPGRTTDKARAKVFKTERRAQNALYKIRQKYGGFGFANVEPIGPDL